MKDLGILFLILILGTVIYNLFLYIDKKKTPAKTVDMTNGGFMGGQKTTQIVGKGTGITDSNGVYHPL